MSESENALIRLAQAGDTNAFGRLVKQHAGRAIGAACLFLGNEADALDASQEAFVRAWRHIKRFNGQSKFYTWYSAILRNLCISRLRKRRVKTVTLDEARSEATCEADPAMLAERNEQADRLCSAIGRLQIKHREIIIMYHFQHMSYAQIAETLGAPAGTVMSRLHHARGALRKEITGEGL